MYTTIHSIFCTLNWNIIQEISIDYSEEGLIEFDLPAKCPHLKRLSFCARTPKTMNKALIALQNNTGSLEHVRIKLQGDLLGAPQKLEQLLPVIEANKATLRTIDLHRIDNGDIAFLPFIRMLRDAAGSDPQRLLEIHQEIYGLPFGSILLNGANILVAGMTVLFQRKTDDAALATLFRAITRFQSGPEVIASLLYRQDLKSMVDQATNITSWLLRTLAKGYDDWPVSQLLSAGAVLAAGWHGYSFCLSHAESIHKFASMECLELAARKMPQLFGQLGMVIRQLFNNSIWSQKVRGNHQDHSHIYGLASALSTVRSFSLFVFVVTHPSLFDAKEAPVRGFNPEQCLLAAWNTMEPFEVPELTQILKFYESNCWKLSKLSPITGGKLAWGLRPLPAKHLAPVVTKPEAILDHYSLLANCLTSYDDLIPKLLSFIKIISNVAPNDTLPKEIVERIGRKLWTVGFQGVTFGPQQLFATCKKLFQEFPDSTPQELIQWAFLAPAAAPRQAPFSFGNSCHEIPNVKLLLASIFNDANLGGLH
eukprot:TRINITY_DN1049_c0_g1_i2.p1 TRINITY_DN1049_c0_g1~~TRINITY_DN1049_c0_g1_i2.p1  ORF type:complete len:537 (+),score=58.49 TRINITY_DN1049_c0_g1_i2:682-2292(+)